MSWLDGIDWHGTALLVIGGWQAYKEWRQRRAAKRTAAELGKVSAGANLEWERERAARRIGEDFAAARARGRTRCRDNRCERELGHVGPHRRADTEWAE